MDCHVGIPNTDNRFRSQFPVQATTSGDPSGPAIGGVGAGVGAGAGNHMKSQRTVQLHQNYGGFNQMATGNDEVMMR